MNVDPSVPHSQDQRSVLGNIVTDKGDEAYCGKWSDVADNKDNLYCGKRTDVKWSDVVRNSSTIKK